MYNSEIFPKIGRLFVLILAFPIEAWPFPLSSFKAICLEGVSLLPHLWVIGLTSGKKDVTSASKGYVSIRPESCLKFSFWLWVKVRRAQARHLTPLRTGGKKGELLPWISHHQSVKTSLNWTLTRCFGLWFNGIFACKELTTKGKWQTLVNIIICEMIRQQ